MLKRNTVWNGTIKFNSNSGSFLRDINMNQTHGSGTINYNITNQSIKYSKWLNIVQNIYQSSAKRISEKEDQEWHVKWDWLVLISIQATHLNKFCSVQRHQDECLQKWCRSETTSYSYNHHFRAKMHLNQQRISRTKHPIYFVQLLTAADFIFVTGICIINSLQQQLMAKHVSIC